MAPLTRKDGLWEATGRDFTRIGRECPLVRRRPKKAAFSLGLGRFWPFCPLRRLTGRLGPYGKPLTGRDGPYGKGPLQRGTVLTGRAPLRGVPYRDGSKKGRLMGLRGEILPELGRNFRLCAVYQKGRFFLGLGRFWLFCPLRRLTGRLGPYGKPLTGRDGPYGKGPLTGSPLRGWLPLQKRTAYGKLRGEILPESGGNFRLCAVNQKRPFFLRAGPFLAFLPFKEAYGKAGPLREAPYGEGRSLREGPPYGEGRSLREGPPYGESLTGMAPFTKLMGSYQNWAGIFACAP